MTSPSPMRLDLKAPHQIYKDAKGKRLCGVTTLTGTLPKDLQPYAARMEREGVREFVLDRARTQTAFDGAPYADVEGLFNALPEAWFYRANTQKQADFGTVAHAHIEAFNKGTTLSPEGLDEKVWEAAKAPLERWKSWLLEEGFEVVESECQLVHPTLNYGGTIDTVLRNKARGLVLADVKTSKANRYWPYESVKAQVCGGYAPMYEAVRGVKLDACMAYRVGKEADDPGQKAWFSEAERRASVRLFLAARETYEALKAF